MKLIIPAGGLIAASIALASPAFAQGAETTEQAVAQYNAARKSGVTALTTGEQIRCAGYWFTLEKVQGASKDNPFWTEMPMELSERAAKLMREGWAASLPL